MLRRLKKKINFKIIKYNINNINNNIHSKKLLLYYQYNKKLITLVIKLNLY